MAYFPGENRSDYLRRREAEEKENESRTRPSPDGCYLFVLFPTHGDGNVYEVGKSCVKAKRYMQGGRFVGIAKKVFSYGYETKTDEACIVFHFVDREAAQVFFQSDPEFKQPDFPLCAGHCQAWVVDRYYTPQNEQAYNTFMISEIRLRNPENPMRYKDEFSTPFAELLLSHDAQPYVVQTTEVQGLRRFCKDPHHIVTVHLFRSPASVSDVMNNERYEELKLKHSSLAFEMCSVFTIQNKACP